jgi:hypothetical protein
MKTIETKGTLPSLARRAWPIALLGIIGVLSLLIGPLPDSLLDKAPELAALSPLAQKGLLLINPSVLVLLAAIIGAALAHRVGLHCGGLCQHGSSGW